MDIVVTLKRVPDPNIPSNMIAIEASGQQVVTPQGIPPVTKGVRCERLGGGGSTEGAPRWTVTALSVGDEGARDALRHAISVGATAAIHIAGPVVRALPWRGMGRGGRDDSPRMQTVSGAVSAHLEGAGSGVACGGTTRHRCDY